MAIAPTQYVPLLRWRMGEYQALFKLAEGLKPAVVPLIEVLPPDFDFEQWRPKKEIDDHLGGFAAKLEKKWSDRPALIDGRQLAPATRMADGRHTMTFLFDEARKLGASLTPVINLESDAAYRKAVHDIDAIDMNGAVLRCTLEEALDPDFDDHVDALLKALAIDIAQLDIVLDLGAPAYSPQGPLVGVIRAALNGARMLSARSVVVMAASFPETMTELKLPIQTVSREEWRLYAALVTAQSPQERRPSFGDYAVAAVKFAQGDMRFMRGSPNVRYAVSDGGWLVARSKRKKGETNQAYPGLCGLILSSGQYHGATFSEGSAYIEDCHTGAAKRGNPTVWKWVATNHHITVVLDDLAKLPAP